MYLQCLSVKPKFQLKPMNLTVKEGASAMFHCVAAGDPTPSVQWDRNNRVEGFISDRIKVFFLMKIIVKVHNNLVSGL